MARVAALGDAHLGRSYLTRTTESGVNQRERDFELSFEAAIDLALSLSPDVVVWLGDIFDHPRPTYRSYGVAQRALTAVREHGAALVAISGNHDTPRLPGTGSPYAALAHAFPELHLAYRLGYEHFDLPGLRVHAVPQTLGVAQTLEALDEAQRSMSADRVNLLLTHPRLKQVEPPVADINEIEVDSGAIVGDFALLGHYHFTTQVRSGVWYAGSTDTFTWADNPREPKGIVLLDTDSGLLEHHRVEGREFQDLEPIAAAGLSPSELEGLLVERASTVRPGAIARLYVNAADPQAYRLVDHDAVRAAADEALAFQVHRDTLTPTTRVDLPTRQTIADRWARYVEHQDLTGYDRERMRTAGEQAIKDAIDQASA